MFKLVTRNFENVQKLGGYQFHLKEVVFIQEGEGKYLSLGLSNGITLNPVHSEEEGRKLLAAYLEFHHVTVKASGEE